MKPYLTCHNCGSDDISNYGTNHRGKQNYIYRDCGRQFVENPQQKTLDSDTLALVEQLLLERLSLAGIARTFKVTPAWLQGFVNRFHPQVKHTIHVLPNVKKI